MAVRLLVNQNDLFWYILLTTGAALSLPSVCQVSLPSGTKLEFN